MSKNVLDTSEKIIPTEEYLSKLPKESFDRVETQIVRNAASLRAVNDPLPGPMLEAVSNEPIQVQTSQGPVAVRKMVPYDITILKKFNSPFYRQMLESAKETPDKADVEFSDEESYEMVLQFILPALEMKKLADKGHAFFTNAAIEQVAITYDFKDIKLIIDAIVAQIKRAFDTIIQYGVSETDSLEATVNKYAKTEEEKALVDKKK